MDKKQFIKDLKDKDNISSTFLVKNMALMEARDGKPYLNIVISDRTGDFEGRCFISANELSQKIDRGDYVWVKGKVQLFQNRLQMLIQDMEKVAEHMVEREDYVITSSTPVEKMFDDLMKMVEQLKDEKIRQLLINVLTDPEMARRLKKWQAGKTIHHAYEGGLLEHILSCAKLAVMLSRHYQLNDNYIVAGAIFHDLGKVYELSDGNVVNYTEEGHLIGHLVKGLELIDRYAAPIKDFSYKMRMHLKHLLLSHHGSYEHGSPKLPLTKEAQILHLIDLMDSKMGSFDLAIKQDFQQGPFTGYIKHLDCVIFKGELPTSDQEILGGEPSPHEGRGGSLKDQLKGWK